MYIEQLYTNCLAEAAYYIESEGEVAIIDPLRNASDYLALAKKRNAKIKYVFETHFHADFVSGHQDLAKRSGAKIVFGPTADPNYEVHVAQDEELFALGNIKIKLLHTPGHTMESSCLLLLDEEGTETAVFTGDTLLLGDVGRPDLAVKTDLSREDLAKFLYNSIQEKLLSLDDTVTVYPGHGAGSQCGKHLSKEKTSSIGDQKKFNYALQANNVDEFIQLVTADLVDPPGYFQKNADINKQGVPPYQQLLKKAHRPLGEAEVKIELSQAAILIDTRPSNIFCSGFIPGSYSFGLDGSYSIWAGTLLDNLNAKIVLVTEKGSEIESIERLARVGFDNVVGYLSDGLKSWTGELSQIEQSCPVDFVRHNDLNSVIDVRTAEEYKSGRVEGAINFPLATLNSQLVMLNKNSKYYIYCKSGYRSTIASSILKQHGFKAVVNIKKGYEGIKNPKMTCCCLKTVNV